MSQHSFQTVQGVPFQTNKKLDALLKKAETRSARAAKVANDAQYSVNVLCDALLTEFLNQNTLNEEQIARIKENYKPKEYPEKLMDKLALTQKISNSEGFRVSFFET